MKLIEENFVSAKRVIRYAIKKDTKFDKEFLRREMKKLPAGYELARIDSDIYDKCLMNPITADFVSSFESKEHYLEMGRGMVILKDGEIVSGASSYTRYAEGIEIEVDTVEQERRKHLATIVCSALTLSCYRWKRLYILCFLPNVASAEKQYVNEGYFRIGCKI